MSAKVLRIRKFRMRFLAVCAYRLGGYRKFRKQAQYVCCFCRFRWLQ